ncbi:MAG: hypothetical protein ACKPKO_26850 [Candidatus Fonsibacter sp.]
MEDEERAIIQRELAEWRERQQREWEREWMLMQRKRQYRRERDDIKRGYWEVTEPLTPDEENELQELKNYDLWEEFINPTTGRPDWRLRDQPNNQYTTSLPRKTRKTRAPSISWKPDYRPESTTTQEEA